MAKILFPSLIISIIFVTLPQMIRSHANCKNSTMAKVGLISEISCQENEKSLDDKIGPTQTTLYQIEKSDIQIASTLPISYITQNTNTFHERAPPKLL